MSWCGKLTKLKLSVLFGPALLLIHFNAQAVETKPPNPSIQELVTKAEEYTQDQKYDKAIAILEELQRSNPHDHSIDGQLLTVYQKQADVLSKSGRTDDALKLLERSKKLAESISPELAAHLEERESDKEKAVEPEMVHAKSYEMKDDNDAAARMIADEKARVLVLQAIDSYKKKQYGLARGLLLEGIKYYDKSALVFELLGDIEYYSQNLESAKEAYQKSYQLKSSKRVQQKLDRLIKEQKLEHHLSEYLDEHFVIRYNRREQVEGSEIREYLRDAYKTISKDFGHFLNYKTVVILYGKEEYRSVAQIPHWSGALFDGKIRIPFYDSKIDKRKLQKLIQHELTHVFVIDLSANHCPVWLHEGLAQYEENKVVPINLKLFRLAVWKGTFLSPAELVQGIVQDADDLRATLFYTQSYMIVNGLIEKYHFISMKQLLKEMSSGKPFPEAFQKTYEVSFEEYLKNWKEDVKLKFKAEFQK